MPQFSIIYGDPETPKSEWREYREPLGFINHRQQYQTVWDTPQDANTIIRRLNENAKIYNLGVAYMMRRLSDVVDFLSRECSREGYTPFDVQGEEFHCAELIEKKISYYEDIYAAYDDRRSDMKLGRYLRKYTKLDENEISAICARNGVECGDATVLFAKTRDEIARVYAEGPRSCMKSPRSNWGNNIHPTEAYAAGDIEIAYLERDGRITARTVCVPKDKKWLGIYGDRERLKPLLEELGYTMDEDGSCLVGCKLLKLDTGDGWACPYLDGEGTIHEGEEGFMVIRSGWGGGEPSEDGYIPYDFTPWNHDDDDYGYDDNY